jgi:cell wall-associated NlpC family hydrolase
MKYLVTFFLLLLLGACGTTRQDTPVAAAPAVVPHNDEAQMNNLAIYAISLYDTPYQYGGKSRANGFDCSGFVQYVFQNSLGLLLPRTSSEMSRAGTALNTDQLRPGDLVFFNTAHSPYSHVGIYVGDNRFVHSPRSGKAIMMSSLHEKYWRTRYNGARRIPLRNTLVVNQ